jgi:predicted DNA-binding transcriptional regulator AlpA
MPAELPTRPNLSLEVDDLKRQVARLLSLLAQIDAAGQARSIPQFCARNGISRSFFYVLKKRGKAPRIMHVDGRQIISPEAERDWRLEREREAADGSADHRPASEAGQRRDLEDGSNPSIKTAPPSTSETN